MDNLKNIHGKLGFGCMRLPMNSQEVDTAEMCRMVDYFGEIILCFGG